MTSLFICAICFLAAYSLTRRSLVAGLSACVGLGYMFGALRANILDTFSFLIWDSSVLGVYASYFSRQPTREELWATNTLRWWVAVLILWPVLLTLAPVQHPLIQLVGLRGNVFLLPFLIIGARLKPEELDQFALTLSALNLVALALALTEYFFGLEQFFPRNEVTELIYNSRDVAGFTAFRIPAFFVNAHAYAGTMVITTPFLLGSLARQHRRWRKSLISAGLFAALIGVFLGASRSHSVVLFGLLLVAMFSGELKAVSRVGLVSILIFRGWLVSNNERLQRFTTLLNTEYLTERVSASTVNLPFLDAALEYPFGIGMGGGGTNIPYFLRQHIREPVAAENEYARIMLEEGVLGLVLWIAFIVWIAGRSTAVTFKPSLGRRLARCSSLGYFAMACLGVGMLTSVPYTSLLLMATGWASSGAENV